MEIKDYISGIPEGERRYLKTTLEKVERRMSEEGEEEVKKVFIRGYAALFDSETDLGYYNEVIVSGAFDNCLNDDVRALFNHDTNYVLGRGTNAIGATETLKYGIDTKGLWFEVELNPEISYHEDLIISMERGDIKECSFAFTTEETSWVQREIGVNNLRKIVKVKKLYDVSVVTYPAYTDTSVGMRSMNSGKIPNTTAQELRLRTLKNKLK